MSTVTFIPVPQVFLSIEAHNASVQGGRYHKLRWHQDAFSGPAQKCSGADTKGTGGDFEIPKEQEERAWVVPGKPWQQVRPKAMEGQVALGSCGGEAVAACLAL